MTPPLVSVLLPYRDAERTVEDALRSALAQRAVALEVVAIDDGSTDASRAVVESIARRDPRVVPIAGAAAGIARALGAGLAVARGSLVARTDADDLQHPDRLARQLALLEQHPDSTLVASRIEPFADPPGGVGAGMQRYCAWQNALLSPEDHARERFVESPVCHPTMLVRRDVLERSGGWHEGAFPEDYDLWLRLLAEGALFRKVPEPLYRWRVHRGQSTWRSPRYSEEAIRALKARHLVPELRARARPVAVWGAGPTGRRLARELRAHGVVVGTFLDIDPRKLGRTRQGAPVVAPSSLRRGEHTVLIAVGARGARELVRAWLLERGFREPDDFLAAA